jgi:hypothetical protein
MIAPMIILPSKSEGNEDPDSLMELNELRIATNKIAPPMITTYRITDPLLIDTSVYG